MPVASAKQKRFFGYLAGHPEEAKAKGVNASVKPPDEFAGTPLKLPTQKKRKFYGEK